MPTNIKITKCPYCPFFNPEWVICTHPVSMDTNQNSLRFEDTIPVWCPLRQAPALITLDTKED